MFDVIMPYVTGMLAGSAVVTYRHDNIEAAILIKKIRQSIASWWYRYWTCVMKYKQGMIKKLMESFDIDAARLAAYSLLDFPKYKYSGRLSGDRKSLKAIPARIYFVDTISQ